ncbi:MAG: hypothetical protein ACREQM_13195 [Candidatus Dormibacteraceae bacterium]
MNWSFVRKEWGAVSFVVAVIVGVIAVPVALIVHNPSNTGATLQSPAPVSTPASSARTLTPSPAASPSASPSPSSTPTPGG